MNRDSWGVEGRSAMVLHTAMKAVWSHFRSWNLSLSPQLLRSDVLGSHYGTWTDPADSCSAAWLRSCGYRAEPGVDSLRQISPALIEVRFPLNPATCRVQDATHHRTPSAMQAQFSRMSSSRSCGRSSLRIEPLSDYQRESAGAVRKRHRAPDCLRIAFMHHELRQAPAINDAFGSRRVRQDHFTKMRFFRVLLCSGFIVRRDRGRSFSSNSTPDAASSRAVLSSGFLLARNPFSASSRSSGEANSTNFSR